MIDWWREVTGILFYYKKAFDLIDHRILVEKLCRLNLPTRIINSCWHKHVQCISGIEGMHLFHYSRYKPPCYHWL